MDEVGFCMDRQGARFGDVLRHAVLGPALRAALKFMSTPRALHEMQRAELDHKRAALAGVVRAIEQLPEVAEACRKYAGTADGDRFKQAIGVACRLVMEDAGWAKRMAKGKPVKGSIAAPISKFFSVAQRYDPPNGDVSSKSERGN
jgi:hypothetical protein